MPAKKKQYDIDLSKLNLQYWNESHEWLADFINERNDILEGVEIGVAFGANMKHLLENTNLEKLYGIDPYEKEGLLELTTYYNFEKEFGSYDCFYEHVSELLKPFGTRAKLIRMYSQYAHTKFRNNSLDFVFIDGDHFAIEEDVKNWEKKVRRGGYIMGHDWNHPNYQNITAFLKDYYGNRVVGLDGPIHIWYVEKI